MVYTPMSDQNSSLVKQQGTGVKRLIATQVTEHSQYLKFYKLDLPKWWECNILTGICPYTGGLSSHKAMGQADSPSRRQTAPWEGRPARYSPPVDSTHATGMHTCFGIFLSGNK